jgi:hypothetical protein
MRHCEEPTVPAFGRPDDKLRDEAIGFAVCLPNCFAEPVIRRRFAPTRWLAMAIQQKRIMLQRRDRLDSKPSRFSQGGRLKPAARSSEPIDADYFFIAS